MSIGPTAQTLQPAAPPTSAQTGAPDLTGAKRAATATLSATSGVVSTPSRTAPIAISPTAATFDALDTATAITDSASAAGGVVVDALAQIRRAVAVAADPSVNAPQRAALASGYQTLVARIQTAIAGAGFADVNLLSGPSASSGVTLPTAADGAAAVTLRGGDFTPGGAVVTLAATADLSTPESARTVLSEVDASTTAVHGVLGRIDAQGRSLAAHADAVASLSTLAGSADTSDADTAGLLALQVRQQLGASGGSLVAQAPGSILSLFRDRAA